MTTLSRRPVLARVYLSTTLSRNAREARFVLTRQFGLQTPLIAHVAHSDLYQTLAERLDP